MAEGITLKRIIDMDEATELTSSDYALVDSATGGPKKFALGDELSSLKDDLSQETGENLFNVAEAVDGYLATNGGITVYDGWKTTGYIPVYGLSSICASSKASASGVYNYNPLYFLHSYDAEKNHIRKEIDSSANGVFSIPSGVHYIRFSYHNYDFGVDLMVVSGKEFALYRPYEVFNKLTASAYDDQHQLVADKAKKNIVCFGDSLTYSQYSTNITYPNKLHELINEDNTVINLGIPGEKTIAIASRQGAVTVKAIPPFTLLATGNSNVQIRDVNGDPFTTLLHNSSRPYQVKAPANAVLDGQSINLAYSNGNYIISPIGSGNEVKTFTRPAEITMVGSYYRNYIPIIWAGTNDAPSTETDATNIARLIHAMVNYSNREEYLVLGLTVKAYADVVNKILAYEFGRHYVDVKSYLINYGLDDNNITPTSQDETDVANGVVPASLRYDSVHFNDYGYTAVANCVYNHGKDLGYWS